MHKKEISIYKIKSKKLILKFIYLIYLYIN